MREKVTGRWTKLRIKGLYNVYLSANRSAEKICRKGKIWVISAGMRGWYSNGSLKIVFEGVN
jgi:hypothetical protein